MGCYAIDRLNPEFNSYPSHIDETALTPVLCQKACSVMNFAYASIESGSFCFCKRNGTVKSILSNETNCKIQTCTGDANFYCGSSKHMIVYNSNIGDIQVYLLFLSKWKLR